MRDCAGGPQREYILYPLGKQIRMRRYLQMEMHVEGVEVMEEGNRSAPKCQLTACSFMSVNFLF